jgi:hypothetical protein
MPRLVAFGCSNTYGSGLKDCFVSRGVHTQNPSQYAWPSLLANKLGYDISNLALPGAGNNEILVKLLSTQLDDTDTVIILWTYFIRHEFFRHNYELGEKINPNSSIYRQLILNADTETQSWNVDNAIKNYLSIEFAHLYLNKHGIKCYSIFAVPDFNIYQKPKFLDIDNVIEISLKEVTIDKALDDTHYGPASHELMANRIFEIIKS